MGVSAEHEAGVIRKDIQARQGEFDPRAFQGAVKVFAIIRERFNGNQRGGFVRKAIDSSSSSRYRTLVDQFAEDEADRPFAQVQNLLGITYGKSSTSNGLSLISDNAPRSRRSLSALFITTIL